MAKIIKNKKCRMCDGEKFHKVINFGKNPLVNSLVEKENLDKQEEVFPLVVERCDACSLIQIRNIVNAHEIYKDVDYLYFSGDMPGLDEYFSMYAAEIRPLISAERGLVVEIGSNDGTMLRTFKNWNHYVLGVDPASNVVVRALKNEIPTVAEFFTSRLARSILREYGVANVIYGNNCIAHLNDLRDLMRGVQELLVDGGVFAVECNYWGGMVKNKNYALIYHDHFSYFTLQNWINFAPEFGLQVFDAYVTPAQGGSLRVFMQKTRDLLPGTPRCNALLQEEKDTNLAENSTCIQYRKDVEKEAAKLYDLIYQIKRRGASIAGYGAAAKGFSVLKLAGIDQRHIDYFVDDSPAKQGKYTPVTHIQVISRDEAEAKLPAYFFITAPNYEKIIIEKERARGFTGKFITCDSRIIE